MQRFSKKARRVRFRFMDHHHRCTLVRNLHRPDKTLAYLQQRHACRAVGDRDPPRQSWQIRPASLKILPACSTKKIAPSHSQVSLYQRLKQRIEREGPITFYDWMKAALYDPAGGYYQRSDLARWGREGDYRTSPE